MAELKDKVTRKNLPAGQDGEALVLDSNSADGLRWVPGIDRLITDITPELSGDLDANDNSITDINNLAFHDTAGTVAGIQNQNLIDRTDAGSIADVTALTFDDVTHPIAGIQNQNLVDKEAAETINGAWTHGAAIAMGTNKITGLGNPTAAQDAATKTYVDTQHAGYLCASKTLPAGSLGTGLAGQTANITSALTSWTLHANSGWSESSGEFKYDAVTGSDTRLFLVNWSFTSWFYSSSLYLTSIGKIEKKPDGGAFADVAGSIEISAPTYYLIFWGNYVYYHALSGSCIVSMQENDVIQFRYGTYNIAAITYAATAYPTTNSPGMEGATFTITPIS